MLSLPVSMTQGCFPIISDRNLTTAHCVVTVSDSAQDTDTGKCNVNELPKRILPFLILRIHRHYFYIWQQNRALTMLKHECILDLTIGCQDKYQSSTHIISTTHNLLTLFILIREEKNNNTQTRASYVIHQVVVVLLCNSRLTSQKLRYFKSSEEKEVTQD